MCENSKNFKILKRNENAFYRFDATAKICNFFGFLILIPGIQVMKMHIYTDEGCVYCLTDLSVLLMALVIRR